MQQADVENIVRSAGEILAAALERYWPTNGNNEVAERNVTLALARAFGDAGFHLYAEGHSGSEVNKRIDLVALDFDRSVQVVVEAKRLYNSSQVAKMVDDIKRVSSFELCSGANAAGTPMKHRFGLILGTTWRADYFDWFTLADADHPRGAIWEPFATDKRLVAATWGGVALRSHDPQEERPSLHHLVYCLFPIASP